MTGASLSSVRRFEAAGQGTLGLVVRIAQALHVVEDLDALFVVRPQSIAQAQAQQRPVRQRARRTAGAAQHRS